MMLEWDPPGPRSLLDGITSIAGAAALVR